MEHTEMSPGEIVRAIRKHDEDLYRGDARKPGITTRLETIEKEQEDMRDQQDKMENKYNAIMIMWLTALIAFATDIIIHFWR